MSFLASRRTRDERRRGPGSPVVPALFGEPGGVAAALLPAAVVTLGALAAGRAEQAGAWWARAGEQDPTTLRPTLADPVRIQLVRELAAQPDWTLSCSNFDVPVGRATKSHHFTVLRGAGIVEQQDQGPKRLNRLRREELDARFPASSNSPCAPTTWSSPCGRGSGAAAGRCPSGVSRPGRSPRPGGPPGRAWRAGR
ncbi:hypothetical protein STANM309S_02669 [Streptomyces tanashiensis]